MALEVADALCYLHNNLKLLHSDLKPRCEGWRCWHGCSGASGTAKQLLLLPPPPLMPPLWLLPPPRRRCRC